MEKEEFETKISEILETKKVKISEYRDGFLAQVNYEGTLKHQQIESLIKLGGIEINRSGAGMRIFLTTIKSN